MSLKTEQENGDEMMKREHIGESERKNDEFLGIKLKRGIMVRRRGGNTTPSPLWRFRLSEDEAIQPHDFSFPSNFAPRISARKLAAELWEVQPQLKLAEMKKGGPRPHLHKLKNEGIELSNQFDEPPDVPQDQPTTSSNMKKSTKELLRGHQSVEKSGHALQSVSSTGSGVMETIPNYSPQNKVKPRQSINNTKTSTELLRVLNRIWNLEEQHRSNVILADTMKNELDQARTLIKLLVKEKKLYHQETEESMKTIVEDKEQYRYQEAILSINEELKDERKMRKNLESQHLKLGRELSAAKSWFSNAYKDLERERKARLVLEDLCDEFAKGIINYEQEVRDMKRESEPVDRLIIHFSEAWLDERIQMKLTEDHIDKQTILDKLIIEIEAFLQAQKSRSSKESFHLNDAGSAPRNENDKEDSADSEISCGKVKKNSNKQRDRCLLHSEYQKYHHTSKGTEFFHDQSSPVERWTSVPDLEASKSSSRWQKEGVKDTTLKEKLLEARLESQKSRSQGP